MRNPNNTMALPHKAAADKLVTKPYASKTNGAVTLVAPAAWVGEANNRAMVRQTRPRPMVTRLKTAMVVAVSRMMVYLLLMLVVE